MPLWDILRDWIKESHYEWGVLRGLYCRVFGMYKKERQSAIPSPEEVNECISPGFTPFRHLCPMSSFGVSAACGGRSWSNSPDRRHWRNKCPFGIVDKTGLHDLKYLECRNFAGPVEAAEQYLKDISCEARPSVAVFAVASDQRRLD